MTRAPLGPYQLQAAIAAVHAEAADAHDTDGREIAALYALLDRAEPSPIVTLNRAVAVAMADGPEAGLALLATLDGDERMANHHRLAAVRAHLHELAGDHRAAVAGYREAARRTTSLPERNHLESQAARLVPSGSFRLDRVGVLAASFWCGWYLLRHATLPGSNHAE